MSTLVCELFEACIIAAEFHGGVIIGGDSRSIKGEFDSNDSFKNFAQVRKQIYIFAHGLHSQVQNTILQVTLEVRRTEELNDPEKATVLYVANLVSFFIDRLEQETHCRGKTDYIIAGWDKMRGAQVYYVTTYGSNFRKKVAVIGTGLLNDYMLEAYVENMTEDECVKFVEQGVRLYIERNIFSGGSTKTIKMIKCDKEASYGKIIPITPTSKGETVCSASDVPFTLIDFEMKEETVSAHKEDPV